MIVDADAIKPIIVLFGTGSGDAELGSEAAIIPIASGEVGLGTDCEDAGLADRWVGDNMASWISIMRRSR